MAQKDNRAKRNKTLLLTPEERTILPQLTCPYIEELSAKQKRELLSVKNIINKTVLGNLMDVIDYLPKEFADLIIIDPPYNLSKNFNGFRFNVQESADYLNYLRGWFKKVVSLLKPTGSLYLCGDWKCTAELNIVMREYLTVLNRITWQREKGRGASSNWKNGMEDIWFGVKDPNNYYFDVDSVKIKRKVLAPYKEEGKPKDWEETKHGKFRLTHPSNFWDDITVPYWSMPENTDHPTQKPEKLIAKLILASSKEGDIVFDPFLGSGTTSVTAKKLNRNYIGVEMNEDYVLYTQKRLQLAEVDSTIQGYSDGCFWERNTIAAQRAKELKVLKK